MALDWNLAIEVLHSEILGQMRGTARNALQQSHPKVLISNGNFKYLAINHPNNSSQVFQKSAKEKVFHKVIHRLPCAFPARLRQIKRWVADERHRP
jgi:hypothetical protein